MSTEMPINEIPVDMSADPTLAPPLSGQMIRRKFLDFFSQRHGHAIVSSASLVPDNPTVLLTPAGMLPFAPIFLGIQSPPTPPRATSAQKCARVSGKASDLENVGRTPRHHTFFEMLGNFSFGDYFKADVIPWAWAFLTQELGLSPDHLWVSVLKTDTMFDEEALAIWRDQVGVPESRILFCDETDNFWGPPGPTGPCGPCSEIYYDRTPDGPSPQNQPDLLETDRFVEIWNLVFMELFQDAEGNRTPLEHKNIDTGMGLERIAMVMQQKNNTFETDLLMPIVERVATVTGTPYGQSAETDVALRIVADHARFVAFALADGILPSNEGRGYIIRMILRRAVRYARKSLGVQVPFLNEILPVVIAEFGEAYPELREREHAMLDATLHEEKRFLETLDRGLALLESFIKALQAKGTQVIPGDQVFKLYDTYGFPAELTADIAKEHGLSIDVEGFEAAMEGQRTQARKHRKNQSIVDDQVYATILEAVGATPFTGYDALSGEATVVALIRDGQSVERVEGTNQPFELVLDTTPFYAESGGQVGDRGTLSQNNGPHGLTVVIRDTVKIGNLVVHHGLFDNGSAIAVGDRVVAQVEPEYRQLSAIHHTATHLLNAALRRTLGDDLVQAGSHVSPEGARFDFTLNRPMASEEFQRVEYRINQWIREDSPRTLDVMNLAEAKASGAVAMAGEAYGDAVRVVAYGSRSRELCGGTHVERLGEIGMVKLLSETGIASGVRRIELVAGERAYKAFKQSEVELTRIATLLKSPVCDVPDKVERLNAQCKAYEKQIEVLEARQMTHLATQILAKTPPVDGCLVLIREIKDVSARQLKPLAEALMAAAPSYFVLIGAQDEGRAAFIAAVSPDQIKQGVKAGDWVKQAAKHCDGGGGGKPGFAQAGGKNGNAVPAAIEALTQAWQDKS